MKLAVVVSAHSNWRSLDLVLLGYRLQSSLPDLLIVAEDSEFPEVAQVVARHAAQAPFPIQHLHQPNLGFRKWRLLNCAIRDTACDYIVFTDADVLPRADVVATFRARAHAGRFLSAGSHVNLPAAFHEPGLNEALIRSGQIFDANFLAARGIAVPRLRLLAPGRRARLLDRLTQRQGFAGNLSGAWRDDLLRVQGFDESFKYGGGDRNLGLRMNNVGVRGERARHSLVCLHLDHARSYRNLEEVARNKDYNRSLRAAGTVQPRASLFLEAAAAQV